METVANNNEFDFEQNDNKEKTAENKGKKNLGKKVAMTGAGAVAGAATAIGAEAAMNLSEENIIDPEMVTDTIEGSSVAPKASGKTEEHHTHAHSHAAPSHQHLDNVNGAAAQFVENDGSENEAGETAVVAEDGETLQPIANEGDNVPVSEVVVPEEIVDVVSGEDVAMILDDDSIPMVDITPIDELLPINELDGLAEIDPIGSEMDMADDGLSFIDDLV